MSGEMLWVIEDNDQNFELVEFLLEEAGFRLARARQREEFRRLLAGERPALVLLDMNLPDGSGLELLAEIRAHPELHGVPVAALTAHAMQGDRERFLAAGCAGYLPKPLDTATFVAEVRRLIPGGAA